MDRKKRIRVVAVSTVGLLALFVALVGAPLITVALWPIPDFSSDGEATMDSFSQFAQIVRVSNGISLVSLAIAGFCCCYLLVELAVWFIGPKTPAAETDA